jgi:hypothetical protein
MWLLKTLEGLSNLEKNINKYGMCTNVRQATCMVNVFR